MKARIMMTAVGAVVGVVVVAPVAQGAPIPIPDPTENPGSGVATVYVTNLTASAVPINWGADEAKNCSDGQQWYWGSGSNLAGDENGQTSLAPNSTGAIGMFWMGACDGHFTATTAPGAFLIGIPGQSQFEIGINTTGINQNFSSFSWGQNYSTAGSTGNLYMYNCGNGELFGAGPNQAGANFNYGYGTAMCFVFMDGGFNGAQALAGPS